MKKSICAIGLYALAVVAWPLRGAEERLTAGAEDPLVAKFVSPPAVAHPWVYWFWKNGNISRAGITADLEAMRRAGIRGVILMEVALSVPAGPAPFFSPQWRELFRHAVAEAHRLGIQISLNSAPGWTGSGGPWVRPEQSMQKLVASEMAVAGPASFEGQLPQPETVAGFYQDVAVLAFPSPTTPHRISEIGEKALYQRGPFSSMPGVPAALAMPAEFPVIPPEACIPRDKIVDLSDRLRPGGRLTWEVPAGRWTILRLGRTSTGQTNRPAPLPGLECDKLDPAALDEHFRQFIAQLLAELDPKHRPALAAIHLDSWEVGAQNWTAAMRQEFRKRRGYDPLVYLPAMTSRVVENLEVSERFLWDLRQTVSELIAEKHGGRLRELAHAHGLWLSIEPYDMTPCDDMTLGAQADVPMCEFWSNTFDTRYSVKEATSIAHVYGRPIVAAEAFTSTESWLFHPASVKALGDWAFCEGINRLVIHRYVHQPFENIRPGLSLGPHGLHYERTQTWWEFTPPWHLYLARCQSLLQDGHPVADVLYLNPEGAPNVFQRPDPPPEMFRYDACTPEALYRRVRVEEGRLVLPEGASYAILVLPDLPTMTPRLLRRIKELVQEGATVLGRPPRKSPSLEGYPACDAEVAQLAADLWGAPSGAPPGEARWSGKGVMIWAHPAASRDPLAGAEQAIAQARWIWDDRAAATATSAGERYFRRVLEVPRTAEIASAHVFMTADNAFELWINGQAAASGQSFHQWVVADVSRLLRPGSNILSVAAENGGTQPNPAGLIGALVVRCRRGPPLVLVTDRTWQTAPAVTGAWTTEPAAAGAAWVAATELGPVGIAPWGTPRRPTQSNIYPSRQQVAEVLRTLGWQPDLAADHPLRYTHRRLGSADVYFVSNGSGEAIQTLALFRQSGRVPECWHPESGQTRPLPRFWASPDGRTAVPLAFDPHESYFVVFRRKLPAAKGSKAPQKPRLADYWPGDAFANFPRFVQKGEITGPWTVSFDPAWGGPQGPVVFQHLDDWSRRTEDAIRYYSGPARYDKTFVLPPGLAAGKPVYLDLGRVEVVARVLLNGKEVGIAWKRPFRLEITPALRPGRNRLEVTVVNLWPNRLIGDEHLPPDCELRPNGTLARWPEWLLEGKPSPTGRLSFATWRHWTKDSPLLPSGLLGPVTLWQPDPDGP